MFPVVEEELLVKVPVPHHVTIRDISELYLVKKEEKLGGI